VGINQPFVISSNPDTVLLIDRTGTVRSVSLAQATAVRRSLRK
jgi:ABC-type enterochelin transport system substrate-binding protein